MYYNAGGGKMQGVGRVPFFFLPTLLQYTLAYVKL